MPEEVYPRPRYVFGAGLIVLSLITGSLGTLATLSLVNTNAPLRQALHLDNLPLSGGTTTEHLVLEESSAVIDTVKKVSPAVVSIAISQNVRDFFGNVFQEQGGGSGFIITSDGLILTNKHVVEETNAEYTVITSDGKDHKATVLARDPALDLAVVKIDATGLPVVDLGNSDDLQIGQFVVAIGNALAEFQNTVTVGVISAKNRQIVAGSSRGASERLEGLLQTDAAINPGNSGGPLVNLKGQVIGINTATSTDAQNIGFAIPINAAKSAIESVKKTGKIIRPLLGVRFAPITKERASVEKLPVDHGALIIGGSGQPGVVPGGPADKGGLKEGDIITKINGEEITEQNSLSRILQQFNVGDEVTVTFLRDNKEQTAKVKLDELK